MTVALLRIVVWLVVVGFPLTIIWQAIR